MSKTNEFEARRYIAYVGLDLPESLAFTEKKGQKFLPSGIAYETLRESGLRYMEDYEITRHTGGWVLLGRRYGSSQVLEFAAENNLKNSTRITIGLEVKGDMAETAKAIAAWLAENKPRLASLKEDRVQGSLSIGGTTSDLSIEFLDGTGYRRVGAGYTALISCRNHYSDSVLSYLVNNLSLNQYEMVSRVAKGLCVSYIGSKDWFGFGDLQDVPNLTEYAVGKSPIKHATHSTVKRLLAEFDGDEVALVQWMQSILEELKKVEPTYEQGKLPL